MQKQLEKLEKEQLKMVYDTWIHEHFPEAEVRPWKNIEKLWDEGRYLALAVYHVEDGQREKDLCGYGFFTRASQGDMVLLDYLAVRKEYRNQGIGSIFLQEMHSYLPGVTCVFIETESIASAQNMSEHNERCRRNAFYERAGAVDSGVVTNVYGVEYTIYMYSLLPSFELKETEAREGIDAIYREMFSEELYNRHVRL